MPKSKAQRGGDGRADHGGSSAGRGSSGGGAGADVLVLGSHPCAHFAAALLRQNSTVRVIRATVPGEPAADRTVLVNPELFDLHPLLAGVKPKLDLVPIHGLSFLADDPAVRSDFVHKSVAAYVVDLKSFRREMQKLALEQGVKEIEVDQVEFHRVDDAGVHVTVRHGSEEPAPMVARLLIAAAELPADARRVLGLSEAWESDVLRRYSYVNLHPGANRARKPSTEDATGNSKQLMPMSLDLRGQLTWAWLMPGPAGAAATCAIEQPLEHVESMPPSKLMRHWIDVLIGHGLLKGKDAPADLSCMQSIDLPMAGALTQEDVANRTLLIGPAGGFLTACAEDLYPACWSAVFAAEAAQRALKEKHPQDALQSFQHKWGATLGDYLRGPQQNLRFLLPLVYRNKTMTARLGEAILFGKSVVR